MANCHRIVEDNKNVNELEEPVMRQEINANELDQVVGGTVVISKDYMTVGFSTTREKFNLKNVTYKDCRNFVEDLKDQNSGMTNAEFDAFAKQQLQAKGWI